MKSLQQGKKKLQKGFTLIELMIVVAVIGVLAAIAIPQYQNYVKKAALGSALATASSLKTNIEDYIAVEGEFPEATMNASGAGSTNKISLPTFSMGEIEAKAGSGNSSDGTIKVKLVKGPAKDKTVTLTRSSGSWSCEQSDGDVTLNGCATNAN